jgi:hypothetical protein
VVDESAIMADFDPLALNKKMPQDAQEAILLLVRTWPLFEIALTDWLIAIARMDSEIGVLMVGRMDTGSKINKLKEIYAHLGDKNQVQWLKNLNKRAERYTYIRNIVVHTMYVGHRADPKKPEEYQLIFSTHRPVKGRRKSIDAVIVTPSDIKETASFAGTVVQKIREALARRT